MESLGCLGLSSQPGKPVICERWRGCSGTRGRGKITYFLKSRFCPRGRCLTWWRLNLNSKNGFYIVPGDFYCTNCGVGLSWRQAWTSGRSLNLDEAVILVSFARETAHGIFIVFDHNLGQVENSQILFHCVVYFPFFFSRDGWTAF